MLGELEVSHTKVVIYPALLDTRFEGMLVVNYLTNYLTTKVILTKGVPNKSGHMQMNKQGTQFYWNIFLPRRDTDIAKVEGLWPPSNWPKHSVPETQMTAPRLFTCFPFIPFPPMHEVGSYDIIKWCQSHLLPISTGKAFCMHRRVMPICLHTHWHPHQT